MLNQQSIRVEFSPNAKTLVSVLFPDLPGLKKKFDIALSNDDCGEWKERLQIKRDGDILSIKGPFAVQEYVVNEIQEVYRLQGVKINDKHIEVIVRQMQGRYSVSRSLKPFYLNACALVLAAAAGVMVLAAGVAWGLRHPAFGLTRITVLGDVAHNSAATLRANVAPRIRGNFFTADLAGARQAFLQVPWVREATVHREFPNRLRVILQEHKPVAFWGPEGDTTLVNSFGEVFEANVGDVEDEPLPTLRGPEGSASRVLAMWQRLSPLLR